ncbi:MAG: hypothetical protein ACK462_04695, partial [Planctomyces sp.]
MNTTPTDTADTRTRPLHRSSRLTAERLSSLALACSLAPLSAMAPRTPRRPRGTRRAARSDN